MCLGCSPMCMRLGCSPRVSLPRRRRRASSTRAAARDQGLQPRRARRRAGLVDLARRLRRSRQPGELVPQRRQLRSRRAARQPFAALNHRLGGLLARRGSCALGCGLRLRGRLHDWAAAVGRPTDQLALLASALVRRPSGQVLTHGPRVRSERVQEACRTRLARELRVTRGARGCVCTRRSHRPTARVAAAPRARVAWLARLGRRQADKLWPPPAGRRGVTCCRREGLPGPAPTAS